MTCRLYWDRTIRSCCGGKTARELDYLVTHEHLSEYSRAPIDPSRNTWRSVNSGFLQGDIMMFLQLLIRLLIQITEKSLVSGVRLMWWDWFIQSTCCSKLSFIDFDTLSKKLPLSGNRWTDWDLDTGRPRPAGCCESNNNTSNDLVIKLTRQMFSWCLFWTHHCLQFVSSYLNVSKSLIVN